MAFLPPSTNDAYRGELVSAHFLVLVGALTVLPGAIHYFLPDGGAGVIAGIDLSTRRELILAMFAWIGAIQIPHGIAHMLIGLRYRSLVPIFLSLMILERALMAADGWFFKGAAGGAHPPEHYASVGAVFFGLVFLALSLRQRKGA